MFFKRRAKPVEVPPPIVETLPLTQVEKEAIRKDLKERKKAAEAERTRKEELAADQEFYDILEKLKASPARELVVHTMSTSLERRLDEVGCCVRRSHYDTVVRVSING